MKPFKPILISVAAMFVVVAGIALGSRAFRHFDRALTAYAAGSVLAAGAVAFRLTNWGSRPPTRMYWKRGWELLRKRSHAPRTTLPRAAATNYAAQNFIRQRSFERWVMHLGLSYGGTLAFALTFPLVFGWIHFETLADNPAIYRVFVFGLAVDKFDIHSVKGWLLFNMLNIAAVMMLVGLALAFKRRLLDRGERAVQRFQEDLLPLFILLAVTVTGLMLTVSAKMLHGHGYRVAALVHAASVIVLLLYIPFGKLFHIFQRTVHLCVSLYQKAGEHGPRAHCARCGGDYASQMHVDDLKVVLDQLGFNYRYAHGQHYQDICPPCRRRLLAINQGRTLGR
jgi:hypothetical protein